MGGAKGIPGRAVAVFALAAVIGVAGGLLGAGFQHLLLWLQHVLVGPGDRLSEAVSEHLSPVQTVLVPTAGGVLAGLVLLLVRRRPAPFGIAEIIGIVALRKGAIRIRDSLLQIVSSACTIGTGGSIGKEGANSQLAATVASGLGRMFRVNSRTRSVLLGCGVAAGMATSYNAPIAGAIFVMEAVLGNFAMDVFAPIVVSSVLATILRRGLLDDRALYSGDLPAHLGVLSWNLVLAALLLGVICGFGGLLFRGSLRLGKRAFQGLRLPAPAALGLGGLCVGAIGLWVPEVWGNGFEVITNITSGSAAAPVGLVLSLFVWKVAATVATVGSGGLGGIFTPNLVVGAAFGAFFAYALEWLSPGSNAVAERHEQITFAFVGMAGLCAAMTHAPVTAVVLVFELTGHYELVLPIMLCSITASLVARMLDEDSYYTESLRRRGEELPTGLEELAIKTTYVRDVMRRDLATVRDTASFDEVMDRIGGERTDTLYVLDERGALVGHIELHDVKNFINDPTLSSVVIALDLTRPAVTASPDDSLAAILPQFDDPNVTELAVTTTNPRQLIGRVCQQDVLAGIRSEVLGQQRRARFRSGDRRKKEQFDLPLGWELAELEVPSEWHGLALDALPAAVGAWMAPVTVQRPGEDGATQRVAATQELVLQEGWRVLALCRSDALQRWRSGARDDDDG
ncbi:MAG: chloride channel protein [Planctomycetota bacterium]